MKVRIRESGGAVFAGLRPGDRLAMVQLGPPAAPLTECERDAILVRVTAHRAVLVDLGPMNRRSPTKAQIAVEVLMNQGWTR